MIFPKISISPRGKVARINTSSSTTTTTRTTKTHLKHALGLVKPDVQRERVHPARVEQRHNERKDAQREKSSRKRHRKSASRIKSEEILQTFRADIETTTTTKKKNNNVAFCFLVVDDDRSDDVHVPPGFIFVALVRAMRRLIRVPASRENDLHLQETVPVHEAHSRVGAVLEERGKRGSFGRRLHAPEE